MWKKLVGITASTLAVATAGLSMSAAHAQTADLDSGMDANPNDALSPEAGDPSEQVIVVTAQRRSEASRDVPISITSISSEQLAHANINRLSDAVKLTPGLRFDNQGAASQPTIRGVGTAITTSGGGPNVGIYVDGFFQSNTYTTDIALTKVTSIQVLKGPQGTLFGRNTTGGAILVTTAEPDYVPSAEFSLEYGSFDTLRSKGYATFGLTDSIAVDLEGSYNYSNGFQVDGSTGNDHIGQYRNASIRAGVKADISDDISVLVRYIHSSANDPTPQLVNAFVDQTGEAGFFNYVSSAGQAAYGKSSSQGQPLVYLFAPAGTFATQPGQIILNNPVSFSTKSDAVQGTIKAAMGQVNVTSYTQYVVDDTSYFGDLDVTTLPFFQINVPVDNKTFSQELLFNSQSGPKLQWTAGLNYYFNRDSWDVNASFGTPFIDFGGSSTTTKSYAAFGDLTYEINERLFVTVGARYSLDKVEDAYFEAGVGEPYTDSDGTLVPITGLPVETRIPVDDLENDSITPRLVLRYKPTEETSIYASFTRGYKAGILNVGGRSRVPVNPEKINAYESGFKFDNRIFSFDLAGFYYDYSDLQVSSFQNGAAQIRNAASSEIYGAEAQFRARPMAGFSVYGGTAYTHARYKSFPNAPFYSYCDPVAPADPSLACSAIGAGSLTQTTINADGYKMQRSPEWTGNLGTSYSFGLGGGEVTLSGNLYYTSAFYFDPSQQFRQGSYEIVSLLAEWTDPSEHFTIGLFGDNLTNSRYRTQVLFNTLGIGNTWSRPATWGARISASF